MQLYQCPAKCVLLATTYVVATTLYMWHLNVRNDAYTKVCLKPLYSVSVLKNKYKIFQMYFLSKVSSCSKENSSQQNETAFFNRQAFAIKNRPGSSHQPHLLCRV